MRDQTKPEIRFTVLRSGKVSAGFVELLGKYGASSELLQKAEGFTVDRRELRDLSAGGEDDNADLKKQPRDAPDSTTSLKAEQGLGVEDGEREVPVTELRIIDALEAAAQSKERAGDPAQIILAFGRLRDHLTHALGRNHPRTLIARSSLAQWIGESGDSAGAVKEFKALHRDALRLLGAVDPITLAARGNILRWQGEAGSPAKAAKVTELLLADMLRVLGPDDPRTLTARGNLAFWRGQAGDSTGAAEAIERLLADLLRVMGPNHPNAVMARNNLAFLLDQAGSAGAEGTSRVLAGLLQRRRPDE
jgi:hypothetical protein